MKKTVCLFIVILFCFSFFGCGSSSVGKVTTGSQGKSVDDVIREQMSGQETTSAAAYTTPSGAASAANAGPVDVDLTQMSSTMVYSEVYNMIGTPENYMGKRVRMNGAFSYLEGNGKNYYACLIADATACCAQGIEFILKDERQFPDEYPEKGSTITVTGIFDTYNEGDNRYCQLVDAVLE